MGSPNLIYINELASGDQNFRTKLINIIKEELPIEVNAYHSNIKKGLLKKAAENVHKLKHKISILGLEKSYYLAIEFEEDLKIESLEKREEFEKVLSLMTDFVNNL